MNKKRVAVVFGGFSPEYNVSLKSAYSVINAINIEKYDIIMIGITNKGQWYRYTGSVAALPDDKWHTDERYLRKAYISPDRSGGLVEYINNHPVNIPVDIIFPVMHGRYGEDGTVQALCELAGIPLAGSGSAAAALCMDKSRAQKIVSLAGVSVPKSVCFENPPAEDALMTAVHTLKLPLFVKPVKAGSSIGVTKTFQYEDIPAAVKEAFEYDDAVIIEEGIDGMEVGCAVVGNTELITGRVDEISIKDKDGFFSYDEKYTLKASEIIIPARIDAEIEQRICETGKKAFRALGCKGYARIDMFLKPDGEVVFLEANTIPGFTPHSQLPKMMAAAGVDYPGLIDMLLELGLQTGAGQWYGKVKGNAHAIPGTFGRAWIEIDTDALAHNLSDIRSKIPAGSEVMAVVKANAYGHGVEAVAKRLSREGVNAFAVATVAEAVTLREYVPQADILIMGRTGADDAACLSDYNLIQLAADGVHAAQLDNTGFKLRVHIAIDTGMHRLGFDWNNMDEIEKVFKYKNLTVEGMGTHFASADSLDNDDIGFTGLQAERLSEVVRKVRSKGFNAGKIHAQSSYGIYNHPGLNYDYVRPGIMLYGIHSQDDETKIQTGLRPVLSLKARIMQIRSIVPGESVSYGRLYTANADILVATAGIGYADGMPRRITGRGAMAIVNGIKVPVIGRVCMDMLMLDVTAVPDAKAGDIAVFIGTDGNETIKSEQLAEAAGTITNDLLSGLGNRLIRVYV